MILRAVKDIATSATKPEVFEVGITYGFAYANKLADKIPGTWDNDALAKFEASVDKPAVAKQLSEQAQELINKLLP